jgi:hypothetical protein
MALQKVESSRALGIGAYNEASYYGAAAQTAFRHRIAACLVAKLWQHGMLIIFARNGAQSGRRINAARPNLPLPAICLIEATVTARAALVALITMPAK